MKDVRDILMVFGVVLAIGSSGLSLWFQYKQPAIVSVDLIALSDHARASIRSPKKIMAFSNHMEHVIRQLAQDKHWIIIPKQAAVSGVPDITSMVEKKLKP